MHEYRGDDERLREQVRFFADLTPDEIVQARDMADWFKTEAGQTPLSQRD